MPLYDESQKNPAGVVYLVVKYGVLCERTDSPKEGFKEIIVENPQTKQKITKYIKAYSGVSGMITALTPYENKYENKVFSGYQLQLEVDNEDSPTGFTPVVIDLQIRPKMSQVYDKFSNISGNIDTNLPLELSVWTDSDGKPAIVFKQDGKALKHMYTRANPGECPQPVQDPITGWDYRDRNAFLKAKIDNELIPRIKPTSGTIVLNTDEDVPF